MIRNVKRIRLEQDILPDAFFKITSLRSAKLSGDEENVNHFQFGTIKRLGIQFTEIKEERNETN